MRLPRTIYAIKHNPTGKIYVGSSSHCKDRILGHLYKLRRGGHENKNMQGDFNEYGEDYSFYALDEVTEYEDRIKEYLWMELLRSRDEGTGYNHKEKAKPFSLDDFDITDMILVTD